MQLVRVKDRLTGHHYTIPASAITDRHTLVNSKTDPAVDRDGRPMPPKFNITTKATKATTEATKEAK